MNELTYTNTGDGHTVRRGGKRLGQVRKLGMRWLAYNLAGGLIPGTFGSMSEAGDQVADYVAPRFRYRDFPGSDALVICSECSGRTGQSKVVHRDRTAEHDRWHSEQA